MVEPLVWSSMGELSGRMQVWILIYSLRKYKKLCLRSSQLILPCIRAYWTTQRCIGAVGVAYRKPSEKYYGATNVYRSRCSPGAPINTYVNKGEERVSTHVWMRHYLRLKLSLRRVAAFDFDALFLILTKKTVLFRKI